MKRSDLDTPLAQAILRLFGDLGERLKRRQVPDGAVHAYLFGGCAVHLHTRARASNDVDVELAYDQIHHEDVVLTLTGLPPIDYDDPVTGPSQLVYDSTFNTTLGPLHEGYRDRAICLERGRASPLEVWLPSPEDLAVTKLGRLGVTDVEDILVLLNVPGASWEQFEKLALEANAYYVGQDLTANLAYVRSKRKKGAGS